VEQVYLEIESEAYLEMEAEIKLDFDLYWALFSSTEKPFDVQLEQFYLYNQTEKNNKTDQSNTTKIVRKKRSTENATETCPDDVLVTKIVIYFQMDKIANDAVLASAKALLLKMYVVIIRHLTFLIGRTSAETQLRFFQFFLTVCFCTEVLTRK